MSEHRGNKTRFARKLYSLYRIGLDCQGLPFFKCKCHEMHLLWVFTIETAVILLKNIFESRLIRLEGFNNKISTILSVCSTWPSSKAWARCVEVPEFEFEPITFFFLLLFFSSFFKFFFSFSFHFRYNSFVMFLYIAYNF